MEPELAALARRMAEMEDRQAIADLLHAHAEHARWGTLHEAAALFAEDAVFELRHADPARPGHTLLRHRVEGAQAIVGSRPDIAGPSAHLWPMIHNLRIELDGDAARSTCVSMTAVWPQGTSQIGEYRDRMRKVDGAWRFTERAFVLFGRGDGAFAEQSHAEHVASKH